MKKEDHYYPFGLKHNGYNSDHKIFEFNDGTNTVVLTPVTPSRKETYKYKFQGQELEDEFGKNTYAYQWRDYDPAIARFNKIDRFAEKYQSINPYHFTANNSLFFREIKGDSINVNEIYQKDKEGNYLNPNQVKAFESFAGTKTGKKYLSKFASKGQTIGGVKFDSDGEFHKAGIDLNIDTDLSTNDGRDGETSAEKDNNGRFQINISLNGNARESQTLYTYTHEFFIHAMNDTKDIMDNGVLDYSNIDEFVRNNYSKISRHHIQENLNAQKGKSLYGNEGFTILKSINQKNGSPKTDAKIWTSMWKFVY